MKEIKQIMEAESSNGTTPLHAAICEGWNEGVAELLKHGALPDLRDISTSTSTTAGASSPLKAAVMTGNIAALQLIFDYHPNLGVIDSEEGSLLHLAALSHQPLMVKYLLEEKISAEILKSCNQNGDTVIHAVLHKRSRDKYEKSQMEILRMFLEARIDVNSKNKAGETPIFLAARARLSRCTELLLSSGADPLAITESGQSVIHDTSSQLLDRLFSSRITLSDDPQYDRNFRVFFDYSDILSQNKDSSEKSEEHPDPSINFHLRREISAISVFFGWVELMMMFGRLPILGSNVLMFARIAKSAIKFIAAFIGLLVGFSVSFMVLFSEIDDFKTFGRSFVKTLMMMIGEILKKAVAEAKVNHISSEDSPVFSEKAIHEGSSNLLLQKLEDLKKMITDNMINTQQIHEPNNSPINNDYRPACVALKSVVEGESGECPGRHISQSPGAAQAGLLRILEQDELGQAEMVMDSVAFVSVTEG
ncbi:Transient receptor potential channel pyrexia [Portunus trituberculatus]|uniref:Transient receptor potential channel pyrexia n=1 Tax=Portunus trituberculatus TaxID=210409 RepID=A0A5B7CXA0_PORTR|nr:Transient receptor potential channel pyrexia [Portunus trituberculatus]